MGKLVGTLRLRFERKEQREERIRAVFKSTNNRLENAKREAKRKKKTPTDLLDYLSIVDPQLIERRICDIERFIPRSHNLNKQIRSFIDHLFVKYPVPEFMYGVFF